MRIAVPLVALAFVACVSVGRGAETAIADLPFEILQAGEIRGKATSASELTLARDETAFRTMWAEPKVPSRYYPVTAPSVDFDHWMVVAFFGSEGGSCNHYRFTQVIARPEKTTINISDEVPGRDCVCVSNGSSYIIAKIPWTEKPIDFEIERQLHDCR